MCQCDFDDFLKKVDGLRYDRILLLFQLPFTFVFRPEGTQQPHA